MLHQELLAHVDRPVEFYVYNTDTDEVRVVVIMPTEVSYLIAVLQLCYQFFFHVRACAGPALVVFFELARLPSSMSICTIERLV